MKKLKILLLLLLSIFCRSQTVFAQRGESKQERIERVNAARIGFITERLDLTAEQAEKFWPIYNEYTDKRQELYDDMRQKIRQGKQEGVSASEKNQLIDQTMALKEADIELQKKYKDKLLKVISVDQYLELLNAEKEFNRALMEKLRSNRD